MTTVEPEALAPDEVTGPGTDLEPVVERVPTALEAAAEAALALPGAAGHDEFWALAAQARILSMSGAAPKLVRENPHVALHLALVGRDLGISPSAALELIDVIESGGQVRLSLSPKLMNGQIRRLSIGEIVPVERSDTLCVAAAVGPGGTDRRCRVTGVLRHVEGGCTCDVLGYSEFSWEDARGAGIVGPDCQPGQHVKNQERSKSGRTWKVCGCNQGYTTYPKRMLWWRAAGFAADDYFPEAGLGLYSAEALGAAVGPDGRPIDVESVELPPGYEPKAVEAGRNAAPAERMADPSELWDLQRRLHALPDGLKDELRDRWKAEESRVRGFAPHRLPHRLLPAGKAMVNSFWGKAKAVGVNMDDAVAQVHREVFVKTWLFMLTSVVGSLPEGAQEPSEAPPAPDPAPEPVEAASEPQEPAEPAPDWPSQLTAMAEEVRALRDHIPAEVANRIAAEVQDLHWKHLNDAIAAAGPQAVQAWPPDSPIDLRRMGLCATRLQHVLDTGEVPGAG